jgi:hypothetical protein
VCKVIKIERNVNHFKAMQRTKSLTSVPDRSKIPLPNQSPIIGPSHGTKARPLHSEARVVFSRASFLIFEMGNSQGLAVLRVVASEQTSGPARRKRKNVPGHDSLYETSFCRQAFDERMNSRTP